MRMSSKHMAYSAVGAVDRRGQQNALFVTFVGCAKRFQAYLSQFFAEFYGAYESLGCLDLEIW